MRLGSLFSGIGGLDIACEQAFGAATVWQVEGIDLRAAWADERHPVSRKRLARLRKDDRHGAYNRRVLARHWPEAEQLADVRTAGAHNLAPVDVICGGFPCQDLSVAGKGGGLDGARSGLYAELYRIVCEMQPRYVVIENVPALLKYQERLAADFNAAGYGLRWQPLAAANVGAPHRRKRVFVLATRGATGSTLLDAPPLSIAVRMERAQTWPTPMACDGPKPRRSPASIAKGGGEKLTDAVLGWPTPTTQDGQNNGGASQHRRNALPLNAIVGGALNPAWVELLMGLPSGWSCASGDVMAWPGAHSWPVGRGAAQPDSEPVRLVPARSVPDRALRLRSIGNGVVPQQAMAALALLMEGPRQGSLFT